MEKFDIFKPVVELLKNQSKSKLCSFYTIDIDNINDDKIVDDIVSGSADCVLITKDNALYKIITKHDVLKLLNNRLHNIECTLLDIVANNEIIYAYSDVSIIICVELMLKHNIKHLPIIDNNTKSVIGVIKFMDIAEYISNSVFIDDFDLNVKNKKFIKYLNVKLRAPYLVLFIDINNLKLINDTFGHVVGDKYIKLVVEKIMASLIEYKTFCDMFNNYTYDIKHVMRFGGDEFIFIIELIGVDNKQDFYSVYRSMNNLIKKLSTHTESVVDLMIKDITATKIINNNNASLTMYDIEQLRSKLSEIINIKKSLFKYGFSLVKDYTKTLDEAINEADQKIYVKTHKK